MPAQNMSAVTYKTEAVPDDEFVAFESTTLTTDPGRLKPIYLTAADGGCAFREWWDDELQTSCTFEDAGTDYFCLPKPDPAALGVTLKTFSDAECEVAAPYVRVPACTGAIIEVLRKLYDAGALADALEGKVAVTTR